MSERHTGSLVDLASQPRDLVEIPLVTDLVELELIEDNEARFNSIDIFSNLIHQQVLSHCAMQRELLEIPVSERPQIVDNVLFDSGQSMAHIVKIANSMDDSKAAARDQLLAVAKSNRSEPIFGHIDIPDGYMQGNEYVPLLKAIDAYREEPDFDAHRIRLFNATNLFVEDFAHFAKSGVKGYVAHSAEEGPYIGHFNSKTIAASFSYMGQLSHVVVERVFDEQDISERKPRTLQQIKIYITKDHPAIR